MKLTDAWVRNLKYDPEGPKIQQRQDEQIPGLGPAYSSRQSVGYKKALTQLRTDTRL